MWVCISPVSAPCDKFLCHRCPIEGLKNFHGQETGTIYENLAPASRHGQKAQGKDTLRQ